MSRLRCAHLPLRSSGHTTAQPTLSALNADSLGEVHPTTSSRQPSKVGSSVWGRASSSIEVSRTKGHCVGNRSPNQEDRTTTTWESGSEESVRGRLSKGFLNLNDDDDDDDRSAH